MTNKEYQQDEENIDGCHNCGYFDGGNCINIQSNHYGSYGGWTSEDCDVWEG